MSAVPRTDSFGGLGSAGKGGRRPSSASLKSKKLCTASGRDTGLANPFPQTAGAIVAPASFLHERIPDFDLLIGWLATAGASPLKQLLVFAALFGPSRQSRITDPEEPTAAPVKTVRM